MNAQMQKVSEAMSSASEAMARAQSELVRCYTMIDDYRRKNAEHERMVGELREALKIEDIDTASDIVSAAFDAIHGPRDSI
jgi:vacuolar-type H+-ATPase subunit H